jgi:ERCC4-type nuclease
MTSGVHILVDSREPWPHPWIRYWPADAIVERVTLETGDFALAGMEDGAVVERKAPGDFLACVGVERERFTRELMRSRYVGHFVVIVEASLPEVLRSARGLHPNAIIGTVSAWTRRYCPVLFAGDVGLAARLAYAWLTQPRDEARYVLRRPRRRLTAGPVTQSEPHRALAG